MEATPTNKSQSTKLNTMKKIILLLLCFLNADLIGQFIEPDFIFKLAGEDSRGNKDSVMVGYHSDSKTLSISNVELDTRFDNEDISNLKWAKSFEMRMINNLAQSSVSSSQSSKNIIMPYIYDETNCNMADYKQNYLEFAQLFIKCKYPPYKITWDTTVFNNNPCIFQSFIVINTVNNYRVLFNGPETYPTKIELRSQGEIIDSTIQEIQLKYPDNTFDTINVHYVIGFASAGADFVVNTKETFVIQTASIYPNPGHEKIYLDVGNENGLHSEVQVKIFSMFGQQILMKGMINGTSLEVDVSDLIAGPYVATLTVGGKRISGRFVKL